MPAGCDFICKNEDCQQFDSGFVMTAPWPMGKICLVVNASRVKELPDFRQKIIDQKNSGRRVACIPFPNIDKIPTECYRVQLWSNDAQCLWQYEVEWNGEECDFEEAIKQSDVPDKCPKTQGEVKEFSKVIADGINCPFCGERLEQSRWFTKEY